MKKIIFLTTILVLSISSLTFAAGFEFDGGYLYTTFDSDTINEGIDGVNNIYQNGANNFNSSGYDVNLDQADDLDSATGFWIGFKTDYFKNERSLGYEVGMNYETFSNDVEANLHATDPTSSLYYKMHDSLDIEVQGFAINGERKINDYFGITGSIGYYYGEVETSYNYKTNDPTLDDDSDSVTDDLEGGAGFKIGVSTDFPVSENLSLTGKANYRVLELDIEDTDESIDFDGWEIKAGLSYKF
jgi:hypothetical protein